MPKSIWFINFFIFNIFLIIFILIINLLNITHLIILIIIYRTIICLKLSIFSSNHIFSFFIFLTIISGLLIIFLYFSSLISNIKNVYNYTWISITSFNLNIIFLLSHKQNLLPPSITTNFKNIYLLNPDSNLIINFNLPLFKNIIYIYKYPFNNFTLFNILFLLISILIIIKICAPYQYSLRKIS